MLCSTDPRDGCSGSGEPDSLDVAEVRESSDRSLATLLTDGLTLTVQLEEREEGDSHH